jgi:hypothetical protein
MKPPAVRLEDHLDDREFTGWRGRRIDVWHLYEKLTALGWKVDTEESNLMAAMSRTWRAEGIKVWLRLENFVCAPPDGEVEALDSICFYRFDPDAMPTETMYEKLYDPGDEQQDRYPSHREAWDWLVETGDPQFDTFELLTPIPLREVPPTILEEAWMEIEDGVKLVNPDE